MAWLRMRGFSTLITPPARALAIPRRSWSICPPPPDIDPDINRKKWNENWKKTRKTGLRIFEAHHRRKDGTVSPWKSR